MGTLYKYMTENIEDEMNFALHTKFEIVVDGEIIETVAVYMHTSDELAIVDFDDGQDYEFAQFDEYFTEVTDKVHTASQAKVDEIRADNSNIDVEFNAEQVW